MTTINDIETLAKSFSAARAELRDRVQRIKDEQEAIKRRLLQGVRNALDRAQNAHDELKAAITASPELFEKPKTRVMHGVRVGWMKQRGKLLWDSDQAVIDSLRKLLGDEAEGYIRTTEKPLAARLAELPAKDLRRCHVTITDDTDAVVVKPADGDLDKLLNALIGDDKVEDALS